MVQKVVEHELVQYLQECFIINKDEHIGCKHIYDTFIKYGGSNLGQYSTFLTGEILEHITLQK